MRPLKEKIHNKLYAMSSILLDNIIVPGELRQEGTDSLVASYYDDHGNKYTFTLSLNVVPEPLVEEETEDKPVTLAEQIATILEKVTALESDVSTLKGYHNDNSEESETPQQENTGD